MTIPALKSLSVVIPLLFLCSLAAAQNPVAVTSNPAPAPAAPLHIEQNIPNASPVLFVSPMVGGTGLGFFRAPDGTAAAIPVSEVKQAMDAGYRPVTFGDMVQTIDNYAKTIQDQQRRLDDLTSDYNALVARFNRLAAINSTTPAVAPARSQADDEKRAMRLMLFQSLLSRSAPAPPPVRVQVTDCTASPALCVH